MSRSGFQLRIYSCRVHFIGSGAPAREVLRKAPPLLIQPLILGPDQDPSTHF